MAESLENLMFRLVFLAVFAAFLASAVPACAQQEWGDPQPLDRLLPQVRERHPGTFYDAEGPYSDANGGMHYRLKWMTPEGRIIWLDTDARTGRVLGVDRGGFHANNFAAPPREAYPPPRNEQRPFDGGRNRDNRYHENRFNGGWKHHDNHHGGH
jgi:hypothetical protein